MYNQFVQGNAELISIASDDSIWNSDSDNEIDDEDEEGDRDGEEKDDVDGELGHGVHAVSVTEGHTCQGSASQNHDMYMG